jgi:hypothetical protein
VPVGVIALIVLLLSGSRGPLLIAILGSGVALASNVRRPSAQHLGLALISTLALAGIMGVVTLRTSENNVLSRLTNVDTTGRDVVWSDTLTVIATHPAGGVGSYLLGGMIEPAEQRCTWFEALERRGVRCPTALTSLNGAWTIAHNGFLHQAGETGLLGTLGLFMLMGAVAWKALHHRDPLALALCTGLFTANLTDNVTLVPSPFFAELFWVTAGIVLSSPGRFSIPGTFAAGTVLMVVMGFPVLAVSTLKAPERPSPYTVRALVAPNRWQTAEPYLMWADLTLPPGTYRLQLRSCRVTCRTLTVLPITVPNTGTVQQALASVLPSSGRQRLSLRLLRGENPPWNFQPLAERSWIVNEGKP